MAFVYSIAMFEMHNLTGIGPDFVPPAGKRWIIRGVDCVNGEALNEVQLHGPAGQVIWAAGFITSIGFDYASYRGRFVFDNPFACHLQTTKSMDCSVWGYELSLP